MRSVTCTIVVGTDDKGNRRINTATLLSGTNSSDTYDSDIAL